MSVFNFKIKDNYGYVATHLVSEIKAHPGTRLFWKDRRQPCLAVSFEKMLWLKLTGKPVPWKFCSNYSVWESAEVVVYCGKEKIKIPCESNRSAMKLRDELIEQLEHKLQFICLPRAV